jgi:hypothetical protein
VDSGLVTGFILIDYKPQQITITGNSFFNSNGSSVGSALQQLFLSTGSSLGSALQQLFHSIGSSLGSGPQQLFLSIGSSLGSSSSTAMVVQLDQVLQQQW